MNSRLETKRQAPWEIAAQSRRARRMLREDLKPLPLLGAAEGAGTLEVDISDMYVKMQKRILEMSDEILKNACAEQLPVFESLVPWRGFPRQRLPEFRDEIVSEVGHVSEDEMSMILLEADV